jgi:YggT family protein
MVILISLISQILFWLVLISVILSYFMDPYHPVRRAVDSIVEPMLAPIRRVVPPLGMFDLSPIVLLLLIQLIANLLINILR